MFYEAGGYRCVHTQTFTCADFGKSSDHLMIDFGNLSRFLLCEAVNLNSQSTNIRASGAWCFLLTLLLSQWLICLYWTVSVHNLTPSDTRTLPFVIKRLPVFFFIFVNSLLSWRLNAPPLPSQQINTVLLNQIFFLLFISYFSLSFFSLHQSHKEEYCSSSTALWPDSEARVNMGGCEAVMKLSIAVVQLGAPPGCH